MSCKQMNDWTTVVIKGSYGGKTTTRTAESLTRIQNNNKNSHKGHRWGKCGNPNMDCIMETILHQYFLEHDDCIVLI